LEEAMKRTHVLLIAIAIFTLVYNTAFGTPRTIPVVIEVTYGDVDISKAKAGDVIKATVSILPTMDIEVLHYKVVRIINAKIENDMNANTISSVRQGEKITFDLNITVTSTPCSFNILVGTKTSNISGSKIYQVVIGAAQSK
jgi:hypothetical protein